MDQTWRLEVEHINVGGPGYLDLALVRKSSKPSWASLQGEWHHVKVKRKWTGEQHKLDLGNVVNGTLVLEYGFLDLEGKSKIFQTRNISLLATESQIAEESRRGVHVNVTKQGAALALLLAHPSIFTQHHAVGDVATHLMQ
jgi:hypothetical protein